MMYQRPKRWVGLVCWIGFVSVSGDHAVAQSPSSPLRVVSTIAPGPYYLGQAIEVKVEVVGEPGQSAIEPPRLTGASIRSLQGDPIRPSLHRYLIVPERHGVLQVPPFRVRAGDRSAVSKPATLAIASIPIEGRTSAFLGGVGSFKIRAEAAPSTLRTGQTLEYRIRIEGPAAWGSVRVPDLGEWKSLTPGFRVEVLPDVLEGINPPIRTFRYALRPSKAGRAVLPPVSIAAFDPKTGRFTTRASSGLPILVEATTRFDPTHLNYAPVVTKVEDRRLRWLSLGLGLAALSFLGLLVIRKRARGKTRQDPRLLALELFRGFRDDLDGIEAARLVSEALTTFLERVDGRPPGALTPPEAGEGIKRLTSDPNLARSAQELVALCDRARFGTRSGDAGELIDRGRAFFEKLADVMGAMSRRSEGRTEGGSRDRGPLVEGGRDLPPVVDQSLTIRA